MNFFALDVYQKSNLIVIIVVSVICVVLLVSAFFIIFVVLRRKKINKNVYKEEEMKDLKRNKDSQSN